MPRPEAAQVARAVEAASRIFIAVHENPDADAVGSLLAMRSMLLSLGKQVHPAAPTPAPDRFAYLAGWDSIVTEPPPWPPDLGIALDCDGSDRLAGLEEALLACPTVIDIDHHRGLEPFGDIQFVVPVAAATAQLVAEIAPELDLSPTPEQASALYTGLIADTGGFRFTNTTPEALRLGADLIEAGADPAEMARLLFSVRPLAAAKLQARALSSLQEPIDGVLIATLTEADFAETGAEATDTDGLIDSFRDVTGTRAAALLKECDHDVWQVSLRGNDVDVASVAASFRGGGHLFAAGCTLTGTREAVTSRLVEALQHALEEASHDG